MLPSAPTPGGSTELTFNDIARVRVKRERVLPLGHLDFTHNRIALGEACLVIGVWGLGGGGDFEKVCSLHTF